MNRNTVLVMVAASVLGGGLIYGIVFAHNSLNQAIDKLNTSEHKIDSAIIGINQARAEIRNLQAQTDSFQSYTSQISNSLNGLDRDRVASDASFKSAMARIDGRIRSIEDSIAKLPQNLPSGIPLKGP